MVNTSKGLLKSHFDLSATEEAEVEEEEKKSEEVKPVVVIEEPFQRPLYRHDISVRLSMLGKSAGGDGYTYLKANLSGLLLTSISAIKSFIHLQYLDLSNNKLNLEALQEATCLPFLILLQADKNAIKSAGLNKMKYFQILILNDNGITSVHDVFQPEMSTIEIGNNKIRQIYFQNRMPKLRCLDFRNNLISDIKDLDFPNLDSLYLASNHIKSLVGLEKLTNLRILHVRNNPIRLLDGFDAGLNKLQYINMRNCKVSTLKQIKKLRVLKNLEVLILKGTLYMGGAGKELPDAVEEEEDPELKIEVLAALQRLKRLNKHEYTLEERNEAKELMLQWMEEGEDDEEEEELAGEEGLLEGAEED